MKGGSMAESTVTTIVLVEDAGRLKVDAIDNQLDTLRDIQR
jgi:hypothetical protein